MNRLVAGVVLFAVLVASGPLLEADMAAHMLIQLPALAVAGWLLVSAARPAAWGGLGGWNAYGVPGLLLAILTALCWMLPLSLDAALGDPLVETLKFITVPLFVGGAVAMSWPHAGPILRGFVWAHVISMQGAMGWLYLAAPTRLCANYLYDQQAAVGWASLGIAAALSAWIAVGAFAGPGRTGTRLRGLLRSRLSRVRNGDHRIAVRDRHKRRRRRGWTTR